MTGNPRTTTPATRTGPTWRDGLLLAAAALLIRAVVLAWRQAHDPLFHELLNDAAYYDDWARALVAGESFGEGAAPYYLPPLYPYALAWLYRLCGPGVWAPYVAQALAGVLTVVGVYVLGSQVFVRRAGLWAGLVTLLFAPPLWYEGWLLPTAGNLLLLVIALNLAVYLDRRADAESREPRGRRAEDADPSRPAPREVAARGRWPARSFGSDLGVSLALSLVLGLVLGLAAILRPQNLLVLAGLLAWWGWRRRPRARTRWLALALVGAGAALAILPVTVRNLRVSGEPVLISCNGGFNFYLGNFPGADGRFDYPAPFSPFVAEQPAASLRVARSAAGRYLDWQGASRYWGREGLRALGEDPVRALKLFGRKARLALSWREMENNFYVRWVHRHTGPGRWLIPSLGLVWLLALPALIAAVRAPARAHGPLWVVLAAVLLTCMMFWVSSRNRLPLVLPLAVFAGASLTRWRLWLRPVTCIALVLAGLLVFWPTGDREGAGFYCELGRIHASHGRFLAARRAFEDALRIEPDYANALNGLALTYMDTGDRDKAISLLRELLRRHPDFELARRNLRAILQSPAPDE